MVLPRLTLIIILLSMTLALACEKAVTLPDGWPKIPKMPGMHLEVSTSQKDSLTAQYNGKFSPEEAIKFYRNLPEWTLTEELSSVAGSYMITLTKDSARLNITVYSSPISDDEGTTVTIVYTPEGKK
jgi:hypothetical protein